MSYIQRFIEMETTHCIFKYDITKNLGEEQRESSLNHIAFTEAELFFLSIRFSERRNRISLRKVFGKYTWFVIAVSREKCLLRHADSRFREV